MKVVLTDAGMALLRQLDGMLEKPETPADEEVERGWSVWDFICRSKRTTTRRHVLLDGGDRTVGLPLIVLLHSAVGIDPLPVGPDVDDAWEYLLEPLPSLYIGRRF